MEVLMPWDVVGCKTPALKPKLAIFPSIFVLAFSLSPFPPFLLISRILDLDIFFLLRVFFIPPLAFSLLISLCFQPIHFLLKTPHAPEKFQVFKTVTFPRVRLDRRLPPFSGMGTALLCVLWLRHFHRFAPKAFPPCVSVVRFYYVNRSSWEASLRYGKCGDMQNFTST